MFSRRKRRERVPAERGPEDAEVSAHMAEFADIFVTGSVEEGQHFDYAVEDAPRLDAMVDVFREGEPADDLIHGLVLSMGAYVGELIVRNGGGRWTYVPEARGSGVELTSGLVCFPLNKVGKRITIGPEHSIAQFVEFAMSGVLPPEARRVDPPRHG